MPDRKDNGIALAEREWGACNIERAEQLLEECPEELRHWEWHFLQRLCHDDLHTVGLEGGPGQQHTLSPDGTRAAGAIGERYDGYLGVAAPVSDAVRSQVASINIQRRTLYSNLAAKRGASPQDVGITAGCQLLSRVAVGQS